MNLSIGILAWNEEASIRATIESLLQQSLFQERDERIRGIEIVIVPNGCTDRTGDTAAQVLDEQVRRLPGNGVTWIVKSLETPGKVNAWRECVHQIMNPDADFIIMMDADIQIREDDALERMLTTLIDSPHAFVATDTPLKHVLFKKRRNLFDRISLNISRITQAAPGQLTGQLYCARGEALRRAWFPDGLLVEDGFLKILLATNMFTEPEDNTRLVRAEDATHIFEAYTRIRDVFANQVRQAVSYTLCLFLVDYVRDHVSDEEDGGQLLKRLHGQRPEWFQEEIRRRVKEGGAWVMHTPSIWVRFKRLGNFRLPEAIARFPFACVGFGLDLVVNLTANRKLKRGHVGGLWQDTHSAQLSEASAH